MSRWIAGSAGDRSSFTFAVADLCPAGHCPHFRQKRRNADQNVTLVAAYVADMMSDDGAQLPDVDLKQFDGLVQADEIRLCGAIRAEHDPGAARFADRFDSLDLNDDLAGP